MFPLPALSPELLEALLAHVTYEEARSLLLPACKRLLALLVSLCGAGSPLKKDHHLAFSPPTPHFELRKTLRRIEYHWGFHAESRKLEAMARLLHELHGRGVVRLEQDPAGKHLAEYASAGTDLRTLRCIFGFHVLDVLDNEAWFSACLRFAVDNGMLRFGDASPYMQVKHMLQALGLTGAWHVRLQCDEVIDSRWRFGDIGFYPYTKRHRALMRVVDAARQAAARQAAARQAAQRAL